MFTGPPIDHAVSSVTEVGVTVNTYSLFSNLEMAWRWLELSHATLSMGVPISRVL